jgi:hypothetical protein
MAGDRSLDKELRLFEQNRALWVEQALTGQWAVIHGSEILGVFHSLDAAYRAGVKRFGTVPFLVKQIKPHEEVEVVHRVSWNA